MTTTNEETEVVRLRRVLESVEKQIQEELNRGYVLTDEPCAGALWRHRWNSLLGQIEGVLRR